MEDAKFKEAIAEKMKDRSQRDALAQLIVEYVQPNHVTADIMNYLLTTRSLNLGDALVKKVRRGIEVRTWVPGSMSLKSELTVTDRINYNLDAAIVSVQANEWELESGELGTIANIRTECGLKLKDYYINKTFTALSTIWTEANTADNFTDVGGELTQTALEDMINRINDTTSGAKAIVGMKSDLMPLTKFGPWSANGSDKVASQTVLDEILRTGWLGRYMGVPVIGLSQVYDNLEDYNPLLPTGRILVIGENVGSFITYGPEKTKEWTDMRPTPPYWNLDIVQQFGMIIDNANGIGVIKVS